MPPSSAQYTVTIRGEPRCPSISPSSRVPAEDLEIRGDVSLRGLPVVSRREGSSRGGAPATGGRGSHPPSRCRDVLEIGVSLRSEARDDQELAGPAAFAGFNEHPPSSLLQARVDRRGQAARVVPIVTTLEALRLITSWPPPRPGRLARKVRVAEIFLRLCRPGQGGGRAQRRAKRR